MRSRPRGLQRDSRIEVRQRRAVIALHLAGERAGMQRRCAHNIPQRLQVAERITRAAQRGTTHRTIHDFRRLKRPGSRLRDFQAVHPCRDIP